MTLIVAGKTLLTDSQGYLCDLRDWSADVAKTVAQQEELVLTEHHWLIIDYLRDFYQRYQTTPALRLWIKYLAQHIPVEQANSAYLHTLFPAGPPKQASKIAGLPKPTRCI